MHGELARAPRRSSWSQELAELDRAAALVQRADHLAGGDVQRGEQASQVPERLKSWVARAGVPGSIGSDRRRAIERLNLALLVHAQHDRALGRIQVEPDDVTDLLEEQRVLGELPTLDAVRLEPERPPDPRHRRLVEPVAAAICARRPMRATVRRRGAPACVTITSSTCPSVSLRGCPGRGSSTSPSSRRATNRGRHLPTSGRTRHAQLRRDRRVHPRPRRTPTRSASAAPAPARSSRRRAHGCNCSRSPPSTQRRLRTTRTRHPATLPALYRQN